MKGYRVKMAREIPGYTQLLGLMKKKSHPGFGKVTRQAADGRLSQANIVSY